MSLAELSELARSFWVVWMMLIFLGIAAWAFWPRNAKRFERDAEIPLRDDRPEGTGRDRTSGKG
ncbi:cytochrome c oxidase cbb3-type subunit 4 [Constrictibacter sp. MBR-5]|jgi:cytochrome c oxidase cbb3-type subunit 4|uniref:cbb3-type cytochrome oxidase subunit 3 n=1 Tax=Constrictibacter sp. MBR-5 TaxID=3156467 RepID=UPI003398AEDE